MSFVWCISCGESSVEEPATPSSTEATETETSTTTGSEAVLYPNIDHLRLRTEPTTTSEVVASLRLGDAVYPTGTLSSFTSEITLRGIRFTEPWVQVKTVDGEEGWVFGGALNFPEGPLSAVAQQLMEYRIQGFFGADLAPAIMAYRADYAAARSDREVAKIYLRGQGLRDSLLGLIERKIPVQDYESLPDLFWLEQALPGFVPTLVAEGTQYYLFNDYRTWLPKSKSSIGKYDDAFMELAVQVYDLDSVEHFFPSWFRQTWDYGGHSNLGYGVHLKILRELDSVMKKGPQLAEPIAKWKKDLLEDITNTENTYWFGQEAIEQELDQIIASDLGILSQNDRVALEVRRKQFADPEKFEISVDQRSGHN